LRFGKEGIQELISNLSKDKGLFHHDISILFTTAYMTVFLFVSAEGKILVEDIAKLASQLRKTMKRKREVDSRWKSTWKHTACLYISGLLLFQAETTRQLLNGSAYVDT
jgi:hypothetical protein